MAAAIGTRRTLLDMFIRTYKSRINEVNTSLKIIGIVPEPKSIDKNITFNCVVIADDEVVDGLTLIFHTRSYPQLWPTKIGDSKAGKYQTFPEAENAFKEIVEAKIRTQVTSSAEMPDPWNFRVESRTTIVAIPPKGQFNELPQNTDMATLKEAHELGYQLMRLEKLKGTHATPMRYAGAILDLDTDTGEFTTEQRVEITATAEQVARGGFKEKDVADLARKILAAHRDTKKPKKSDKMTGRVRSRQTDIALLRKLGPMSGKRTATVAASSSDS